MARRARILTPNRGEIPHGLTFPHDVEQAPAADWDDDDPPDETVLYVTRDLRERVEQVEHGRAVQIRLDHPEQLEDPNVVDAVEAALRDDHELVLRIKH